MDENLTFNLNQVFRQVITRMEDEGSFDRSVYDDLIDEVLEEKREMGELSDDNDIEQYTEKLKMRWPEAQQQFESGHDQDVVEEE